MEVSGLIRARISREDFRTSGNVFRAESCLSQ
jgi:hypothetical protein